MHIATIKKRQVVDITEHVAGAIRKKDGVCTIFVRHTTAAITTADLDPGTGEDFLDFLQAITPDLKWRHPHDSAHAPDHLLASMIGSSVMIPTIDGKLQLGTWQRIVLLELDGPREREIIIA